MVLYVEATAVDDPLVLSDEKFSSVRSKLCIFKEGKIFIEDACWVFINTFTTMID